MPLRPSATSGDDRIKKQLIFTAIGAGTVAALIGGAHLILRLSGKRAVVQQKTVEDERAEEALRESEQRLRSIIDNMTEGLVVVDPGTGALYWNRKSLEMYQFEEHPDDIGFLDQLADTFELKTLDGEVLPFEQWPVSRVLRGEELQDLDLLVWDKKRNWQRIYTYSGILVRDSKGNPQMGLVTLRDITARKNAEKAMRQSEELLRTVLETLPVAVWILSADGGVMHANKAAVEIWGGAPRVAVDELGIYKGWRLGSGKRIEAKEWGGARAIMRGETSLNEEVLIEAFDGSRKIILDSAVPIRNDRGEITGAITVNQDITARKRAEDALRESEEKFRAVFQQAAVGMARLSFADARWVDGTMPCATCSGTATMTCGRSLGPP
ncbi:MAG TPA: hypothetical protein DCZ75_04460 [Geobacter sp.]|nr:hypothetical protein [Geobacter sp.]